MEEEREVRRIRVVRCTPRKVAEIVEIENSLESLQKEVGGSIECDDPFGGLAKIICNEEGKLNGLELNRSIKDRNGKVLEIIAGAFLIAGVTDDGEDFDSLSEKDAEDFAKLFQWPEQFFRRGNDIVAISVRW